jgi:hypothetical protein
VRVHLACVLVLSSLLQPQLLLLQLCALLARADGAAWAWAWVRDFVCMSYPGQTCQLLSCLVAVCMCNHCSLLILNLHTSNPNLNLQSAARSAFAAGLMLLAFLWYTPWGATGAAEGAGAGAGAGPGRGARGARGGPGKPLITNQSPAKLYFRQSGQPRSL